MTTTRRNGGNERLALVIGATGGAGGAVAAALSAHGWRLRALARNPVAAARRAAHLGSVEWIAGDALREDSVVAAAEGAGLIFHGANPPGYRNWRGLAIPMLRSSIAAAKASGARLVFPGNVYNFGPDAGPVIDERAPQHPTTRKGAIRVEMERMLADAARDGVRSLVVRAGDFFGAGSTGSWFDTVMVKRGRPLRAVVYPGVREVGHAWAYLPDLAEAIARVAAFESTLPGFEVLHFGGHWIEPGVEMAEAVRRASGRDDLPIRGFPWALLQLARPFWPFAREVLEMRYLWRVPLRLDNGKLCGFLGEEPHTPLDEAVRRTLEALGCVPRRQKMPASS